MRPTLFQLSQTRLVSQLDMGILETLEHNSKTQGTEMRTLILLVLIAAALANPSRLMAIAKWVNSQHRSWIASEEIPSRDYTLFMGTLPNEHPLETKHVSPRTDLPTAFDAREKWQDCPSIGEIRDQSDCASCWAFGVVEVATDRLCISSNGEHKESLSVEDLLECCPTCGYQCKGGYTGMAWEYVRRTGISTGGQFNTTNWCKSYPFPQCEHGDGSKYPPCSTTPPDAPKCEAKCQEGYPIPYEKDLHQFANVYQLGGNVEEIKTEIFTNGPVDATFRVYEDFLTYKSGIYHHVEGKALSLHTVKMIGWGVENGEEYWLLVNSWNEDWGENGLFRVRLGTNECGIEDVIEACLPSRVCSKQCKSVPGAPSHCTSSSTAHCRRHPRTPPRPATSPPPSAGP